MLAIRYIQNDKIHDQWIFMRNCEAVYSTKELKSLHICSIWIEVYAGMCVKKISPVLSQKSEYLFSQPGTKSFVFFTFLKYPILYLYKIECTLYCNLFVLIVMKYNISPNFIYDTLGYFFINTNTFSEIRFIVILLVFQRVLNCFVFRPSVVSALISLIRLLLWLISFLLNLLSTTLNFS